MQIECPSCGKSMETINDLAVGQHVICPYCEVKFSYGRETVEDVQAIDSHDTKLRVSYSTWMSDFYRRYKKLVIVSAVTLFVLFFIAALLLLIVPQGISVDLEGAVADPMTCPFKGDLRQGLTSPECGVAYYNTEGFKVLSAIPGRGVVAIDGALKIYVRTDRLYVDGCALMPGLYTCRGRATIRKPTGEQMVLLAFDEVDREVGDKRMELLRKQWAKEELERKKAAENARLEREKQELAYKAEQERAAAELARIKAENDRKLEELRIEQEKKAAVAKEIQARKDAEEAAKRYPQEQKDREEYAAAKLKSINFDWENTILMSRTAKKNLVSCQLNEHAWSELKDLISRGEWLATLSAIEGVELADFPDSNRIDGIVSTLMGKVFHIEMNFLSSRDCYGVWAFVFTKEQERGEFPKKVPVSYRNSWRDFNADGLRNLGKNEWILDRRPGVSTKGGYRHDFQIIIEFKLGDEFRTVLFDNDDNPNECRYKLTDGSYVGYVSRVFRSTVVSMDDSLKAGRIDQPQSRKVLEEGYKKAMAMINAEVKPLSAHASQRVAIKNNDSDTLKKKSSIVCPACKGAKKKTVKKNGKIGFEKCERCCGTGRIWTSN